MGYWNEVGQNLSKWPQALGKVVLAAGVGTATGTVVGGTVGTAIAPGPGTAAFAGVGALIGGVAAGATSVVAQTLDTFVLEPTDTSNFAKGLFYYDQDEADANKLAGTEKALGKTQVERGEAQEKLDKANGEIEKLIAENKRSTDLLKTLPAETAVKTTLIIAGYINGQITDDNQDYKTTKSLDEYKSFINSNEYKNNKTKYGVVMNTDKKAGKVFILGLEGRLKAIGIDSKQIKLLAVEIKEIAEEIREEIQAAEKPPTEQAEEVVKPPEEVAKPPEAKLPTESAQPSTEEAKRKQQAESAKNPEPPG